MNKKIIYWIPFIGLYYGIKVNTPFENAKVSLIAFLLQVNYCLGAIIILLELLIK